MGNVVEKKWAPFGTRPEGEWGLEQRNHPPAFGVTCEGESCGKLTMRSFDASWSTNPSKTVDQKDASDDILRCPQGHAVTNVKCRGEACAEIVILCSSPQSGDWTIGPETTESAWFNTTSATCPEQHVIVGLKCENSCKQKRIICRPIHVTVKESEHTARLKMPLTDIILHPIGYNRSMLNFDEALGEQFIASFDKTVLDFFDGCGQTHGVDMELENATIEWVNGTEDYSFGVAADDWDCNCLINISRIWADTLTGEIYLVEQASAMGECDGGLEQEPSTRLLSTDDQTTHLDGSLATGRFDGWERAVDPEACAAVHPMGFEGCWSLADVVDETLDKIKAAVGDKLNGGEVMSVLSKFALPLMDKVLNGAKELITENPWFGRLKDVNFCLGAWTGEEIRSDSHEHARYLSANGCRYPPYVLTEEYNLVAVGIPAPLLKLVGCTGVSTESAYFCLAYTKCEIGWPTFALQIGGSLISCVVSKEASVAISGGLFLDFSAAARKGISTSVQGFGFGFSGTNRFKQAFEVYDGETKIATLHGTMYARLGMDFGDRLNAIPCSKHRWLDLKFSILGVFQMNLKASSYSRAFAGEGPVSFWRKLSKVAFGGRGSVDFRVNLKMLTKVFPDITGSAEVQLVLGSIPVGSGVLPGFYFSAAASTNFFTEVLKFCLRSLGKLVDLFTGGTARKAIDRLLLRKDAGGSKANLIFWFNSDSVGFKTLIPLWVAGSGELECRIKLKGFGVDCGWDYNKPQWISAKWDGPRMIVGEIKQTLATSKKFLSWLIPIGKTIVTKLVPTVIKAAESAINWLFRRRRSPTDTRRRRWR